MPRAAAATAITARTTWPGDAALLARAAAGKPVWVQWMRDDEFAWEPFGPTMLTRVRAVLAQGRVASFEYDVWSPPHSTRPGEGGGNQLIGGWALDPPQPPGVPKPIPQPNGSGDRNAIPLYDFPRQHVTHHFITQMPVRVSALRTLGATTNVFAIESAMDELAAMAGADPVAFRLAHLSDPRATAVIEAAAKLAAWKPGAPGGNGDGRGFGLRQVQEPDGLRRRRRGHRGGPRHRHDPRPPHLGRRRHRRGGQPRWRAQPDGGRHYPGDQLGNQGAGLLRPHPHPVTRLVRLPDPRLPPRSPSSTSP